jgi:hypothetical protein
MGLCCRKYNQTRSACCFFGQSSPVGPRGSDRIKIYGYCSNAHRWFESTISTEDHTGRSYICDTERDQMCYMNDRVYECYNMDSFTWKSYQFTPPDKQGIFPALCLGGNGKYYSFGGATSTSILQWDPNVTPNNITKVGSMPPSTVDSCTTTGSSGMCCVAVPGQPNTILVTMNPARYKEFDFCLYDITTNEWGSCFKCPQSYGADLTDRDCSTCGSTIVLGPGGNPFSGRFTILDPTGTTSQFLYSFIIF